MQLFKSFVIDDIFEKVELKSKRNGFDKDKDVSRKRTKEFSVPLVNAKNGDNGIMYYGRPSDFESIEMAIDIVNDGAISTGNVYPQPQSTGILYNAYLIKLKKVSFKYSEKTLIYLSTVMQKAIKHKYSYDNKAGWDKVKKDTIELPVIENSSKKHEYTIEDIDFEYMENTIQKIEKEYFSRLESFLSESGLDDCIISGDDKETLTKKIEYKKFKIGHLFEKLKAPYKGTGKKQDNVSKIQNTEFSLPLINCKDGNNGIMYYGREADFDYYTNVLSVIYNGPPTVGQVYAQEKIGVYTDAYLIALKKEIMPEMSLDLCFYLKTAVEKAIHNTKYSRANKATWDNKVENDYIYLPTSDGINPDYEYMEKYIKVQKKLTIKDTVGFVNDFTQKEEAIQ